MQVLPELPVADAGHGVLEELGVGVRLGVAQAHQDVLLERVVQGLLAGGRAAADLAVADAHDLGARQAVDEDVELRELFLKAATRVDVVLACRVSPKQKADVVNLIKKRFPEKTTLSIGDGANDVSMILQAHVGIGILGKEGQ